MVSLLFPRLKKVTPISDSCPFISNHPGIEQRPRYVSSASSRKVPPATLPSGNGRRRWQDTHHPHRVVEPVHVPVGESHGLS